MILPSVGPAVHAIISTITDQNVVSFMLVFAIVIQSFSMALHFALGYSEMQYNTLSNAVLSFFRMLFGDFDYTHFLRSENAGTFWFVLSLLSGSLLLLNIFIAVVGEVYAVQLSSTTMLWTRKAVAAYQQQLLADSKLSTLFKADSLSHYVLHESAYYACMSEAHETPSLHSHHKGHALFETSAVSAPEVRSFFRDVLLGTLWGAPAESKTKTDNHATSPKQ